LGKLKWKYSKNERTWSAKTPFCTYTIEDFNFTDAYKAECERDNERTTDVNEIKREV